MKYRCKVALADCQKHVVWQAREHFVDDPISLGSSRPASINK